MALARTISWLEEVAVEALKVDAVRKPWAATPMLKTVAFKPLTAWSCAEVWSRRMAIL